MVFSVLKAEIKKIRQFLHRIYFKPELNQKLIDLYHEYYYDSAVHRKTYWFGVPVWKMPSDLWIYQEIFYELKPDLVIETGTAYGGSAYYMAHLMDILGKGKIITIDIDDRRKRPNHKRIIYLKGSSVSKMIIDKVKKQVKGKKTVVAILDSNHTKNHVLEEMKQYSKFVTKGSYLIVEDSNINGHPVWQDFGPGPFEAIQEFLNIDNKFIVDESREKFYISFNPRGYLKKIK